MPSITRRQRRRRGPGSRGHRPHRPGPHRAHLAVITGTEDRQHAYVALTRGIDHNHAYVFTTSPKRADPVPGPAPELARYDQIHTERAGDPAPATPLASPGQALSVLSAVLDRDGQQQSATHTRRRALADRAVVSRLRSAMTWRNEVERRVSGRVRGMSGS